MLFLVNELINYAEAHFKYVLSREPDQNKTKENINISNMTGFLLNISIPDRNYQNLALWSGDNHPTSSQTHYRNYLIYVISFS